MDAPAVFQRPALFLQGVVRVPPVHLEVIGQDVQQLLREFVDARVDGQALDLLGALGQHLGDRGGRHALVVP